MTDFTSQDELDAIARVTHDIKRAERDDTGYIVVDLETAKCLLCRCTRGHD